MADQTPNLGLPYLMAAQAQKHVTLNESLRLLDALVHLAVEDKDLAAPPASPADGSAWIVAAGATGAWAGHAGTVAARQDGAWTFLTPREGWRAWVKDEGTAYRYAGAAWSSDTAGLPAATVTLNGSSHGATTVHAIVEEELTLAGASVDSTVTIPDRAIVLAVSTRTTQAVTGATSYDCGIAGDASRYGGLLGIAAGSTNSGVTGPTAYYAPTPVRLSANGGNFTGGKVRISIHTLACGAPTS